MKRQNDSSDRKGLQSVKCGRQTLLLCLDSSYLKIDDDADSIAALQANFPGYHKLYPVPLETAKALNIPAVNYGVWGKDCHKWTERIYMPYSFGKLPEFILKTIDFYLGGN